jgi:hypothetical protein
MSGYQEAMEAAGAKVLAYESFGSYQGEWFAKVDYNGDVGWVAGSFGSCSYCDAFEGEFGWNDHESPDYEQRLADFGRTYLDTILPQEKQEELLQSALDGREGHWYYEDVEATYDFVKGNR